MRLLTRTTRSVMPTPAGEQLASTLRPAFDQIAERIEGLNEMRKNPAGHVRLTSSRSAALDIVWPKVLPILKQHPDVTLEISVDNRMTDIVEGRFDAGIRLGESIEKDMIAMRISPEMRMLTLGAPEYFARYGRPQRPQDLTEHNCINLRLPTAGGLYAWEYEQDGKPLNVRVEGQFTSDDPELIIEACLAGVGLCFLTDFHLKQYVEDGRLETVLDEWSPSFPGFHIYYPSRRPATPAFSLLLDALRYRG